MTIKADKRILIVGNGGSGKTTLARIIHCKLAIPILHLDKIYWINSWEKRDIGEFKKTLDSFMSNRNWVIEGTPMFGLKERIERSDIIVFLDIRRTKCVFNSIKRGLQNFIRKHNDDGCPTGIISLKAIKWIWSFQYKTRPVILEELRNQKYKTIYHIKHKKDMNELLKLL